VDACYAQVKCGKLGDLIFHERDERRDDKRGAAESDGGKLITERLPCPGGHDEQQVASADGSAAHGLLIGAETREAEHRLKKLGEIFRVGCNSQNAINLSGIDFLFQLYRSEAECVPASVAGAT
jgi:hypothetical protein